MTLIRSHTLANGFVSMLALFLNATVFIFSSVFIIVVWMQFVPTASMVIYKSLCTLPLQNVYPQAVECLQLKESGSSITPGHIFLNIYLQVKRMALYG